MNGFKFNVPPGWPQPPEGWVPPEGWMPEPSWPAAPPGWMYWVPEDQPPPTITEEPMAAQAGPTPNDQEEKAATEAPNPTTPAVEELDPVVADDSAKRDAINQEQEQLDAVRAEVVAETQRLALLREEIASLERRAASASQMESDQSADEIRSQLIELNDALLLQQVGIYEYHHPLENAVAYKERLVDLRGRIKNSVREKQAILASDMFSYNNSLAKGRKMTADFAKLMLRAYNAEADNCVRSLRAGAVDTAKTRLEASVETIARVLRLTSR